MTKLNIFYFISGKTKEANQVLCLRVLLSIQCCRTLSSIPNLLVAANIPIAMETMVSLILQHYHLLCFRQQQKDRGKIDTFSMSKQLNRGKISATIRRLMVSKAQVPGTSLVIGGGKESKATVAN